MALATDKSVFLHIPKTAGIFIRNAFDACGIAHYEIGHQHAHFPELFKYKDRDFYNEKFLFAFVRHPLTWYQSRWAFRMKRGWVSTHPIDNNCCSNDFRLFVQNVLAYEPSGWYTKECMTFIDTCPRDVDFIGHVENVVEDCIMAFQLAGEKFDPAIIRNIPRINDSDLDGKSSKYWARYNIKLAKKVISAERSIIDRYYSGYDFDISTVCGDQPY